MTLILCSYCGITLQVDIIIVAVLTPLSCCMFLMLVGFEKFTCGSDLLFLNVALLFQYPGFEQ